MNTAWFFACHSKTPLAHFIFLFFFNHDVLKHVTTMKKPLKMLRILNYFCFVLQMVEGAKIALLLLRKLISFRWV